MSLETASTAPALDATGPGGVLVLEGRGIAKSYRRSTWFPVGRTAVLTDAGLQLRAGEVVGLVGENGFGKSTLMRILVGDLAADAGQVDVAGTVGYWVHKQPGDEVIGATVNVSGALRVRATKVGAETALAQIVALVQQAQNSKAPGNDWPTGRRSGWCWSRSAQAPRPS